MADAPATVTVVVPADEAGARLDRFITAHWPDMTRSQAQRAIAAGRVQVGTAVPLKAGTSLSAGASVSVAVDTTPRDAPPQAQDLPLEVIYEDDALAVVNKAAGIVVHPAAGHPDGTLVNALMFHIKGFQAVAREAASDAKTRDRPGIVHRIDKDTSGLLVVAKSDVAKLGLQGQFAAHTVHRRYRTVVIASRNLLDEGTIESLHGRHPTDRKRFTGRGLRHGKRAVTHWSVLQRGAALALLEVRLETGRTHQIRMHLSEAGSPVVGDPLYGRALPRIAGGHTRLAAAKEIAAARRAPRLTLHAAELGFLHPVTGETLRFAAPDPPDFASVVAAIG